MLLVEEVVRVTRVDGHGLEAVPLAEHGAGPFPHAAHLGLACETVASPGHRHGVPVLEADVGAVEVDEEVFACGPDLAVLGREWWWGLFDTVAGEVTWAGC